MNNTKNIDTEPRPRQGLMKHDAPKHLCTHTHGQATGQALELPAVRSGQPSNNALPGRCLHRAGCWIICVTSPDRHPPNTTRRNLLQTHSKKETRQFVGCGFN